MSLSANKMAVEAEEDQEALNNEHETSPESELDAPHWSVVSFEAVAISGVSYSEAVRGMENLSKQKVSGLCIITDDAAARISK